MLFVDIFVLNDKLITYMRKLLLLATVFSVISAACFPITASSPFEGSHHPYTTPDSTVAAPDSLRPFYISYVGRHGSRYPSSESTASFIKFYLTHADTTGTITAAGKRMLELADHIIEMCDGKWGDLDSLGIAEQRGIAQRMYDNYPAVFSDNDNAIEAISSYSPRAVMSMYSFTHQLSKNSPKTKISTSSGTQHSPILRPYDDNDKYKAYKTSRQWRDIYDKYYETTCPLSVANRLVGKGFEASDDALRELSESVYSLISGLSAMGIDLDYTTYMTDEEYEQLWLLDNLHHYLLYSATTLSATPAQLAIPLVENIVEAADRVIDHGQPVAATLRFAHAETLMPLLSLLQIDGCYYLTHYFDQVGENWRDFDIVPMSANLQFVFFETESGNIYVRTDLNEKPVTLIPGNKSIYLPWEEVRTYLLNFILVVE